MQSVTRQEIIKILRKVNMNADVEALDPSKDLPSQGVDSLDMMNVLFELEEAFSIKITDDSIAGGEWLSIDKMVTKIKELLADYTSST